MEVSSTLTLSHLAIFLSFPFAVREASMMGTFKPCFEDWVRLEDVELGAGELEGMEKARGTTMRVLCILILKIGVWL